MKKKEAIRNVRKCIQIKPSGPKGKIRSLMAPYSPEKGLVKLTTQYNTLSR